MNDVKLFNTIKKMQSDKILPKDFLLKFTSKHPKVSRDMMGYVAKAVSWLGPICNLKERIYSINKRNSVMSVRECKKLMLIIREKFYNKKIDYETLSLYFPGKSITTLKETYLMMFKNARNPDAVTVFTTKPSKEVIENKNKK